MLPVYAGSVILLIGYFVANQFSADLTVSKLAAMVDPFGGNAVSHLTQYWTPFQRNTPTLCPLLAFCCGIAFSGSVLRAADSWGSPTRAFLFGIRGRRRGGKRSPRSGGRCARRATRTLPVTHPTFTVADSFRELFSLSQLQFAETVKNVFFGVLVLAGAAWPSFPLTESTPRFQLPCIR